MKIIDFVKYLDCDNLTINILKTVKTENGFIFDNTASLSINPEEYRQAAAHTLFKDNEIIAIQPAHNTVYIFALEKGVN